jgi:hypothetical protein
MNGSSEEKQDSGSDGNLPSGSKTEPLAVLKDDLLCDEFIHPTKHCVTARKPIKTAKIAHLNSLAGIIGQIDHRREGYGSEIVFHSPYWPIPPQAQRAHFVDPQMSPYFKGQVPWQYGQNSSEYSWNNPECKHEKALWRVFDESGRPIPFEQICPSHPCYLVVPQTPDSKMSNSLVYSKHEGMVHDSPPCRHYNIKQEESLPSEKSSDYKLNIENSEAANRSKSKGKNILRLKTKPSEISNKTDLKRKRKEKRKNAHKIPDNGSFTKKIKTEVTSIKNIGKQASKFEEEGKEKPMNCNCKKSKCLKFYCDCLADGRMCTSECNCWDCANNDHHIGKYNAH